MLAEENKETALKKYREINLKAGTQLIELNRMEKSILLQLMRIYKDPCMSLNKVPDVNFAGEIGADVGGPTKEYFSSAIECLTKVDPKTGLQLFFGECGHMVPLCSMDAVSGGCFQMAGKLVAHSILHGGTGLTGLAPAMVKYITCGSVDEALNLVTLNDVADVDLKSAIEKASCVEFN